MDLIAFARRGGLTARQSPVKPSLWRVTDAEGTPVHEGDWVNPVTARQFIAARCGLPHVLAPNWILFKDACAFHRLDWRQCVHITDKRQARAPFYACPMSYGA